MKSKTKVSILFALGIIFLFFSIFNSRLSKNYLEYNENNQVLIKQSGFWDLTGNKISIDDNDPSKNWSYTASHYDWCSGSGSWADPYVIENVTIDGQASGICIEIRNSKTYFIIRNCSLYNSLSGIHLRDSNNAMLSNNTVSNNGMDGIYLASCYNTTLSENTVNNNNYDGISLGSNSYNNTLSGNTANYNNQAGIFIGDCNNNTIYRNNASYNNYEGIFLGNSHGNTVSGTTASNNSFDGIYLADCDNNTFYGNTANNNEDGIYLGGGYNNILSGNTASNNTKYGISLDNSHNNTISGNNANNNNDHGIYLSNCAYNMLSGNNASNNYYYGIELRYSYNNTLSGNIANNNYYGIYLISFCDSNTFSGNTVSNNDVGIYLDSGNNNKIFLNYFTNNEINAEDNGINNKWDDGLDGNYWDDYAGADANDDGIGDTPYIIPGTAGSQDNFPIYDNIAPIITIFFPLLDSTFGFDAPNYDISIDEINLVTIWYTFDEGGTNYTITSLTGTFNQTAWEALSEDNITIKFYADDAEGNIGSASVTVEKDISAPVITIIFPLPDSVFGFDAPNYDISIDEINLDTIWYTLDWGGTNYTITSLTGTFNQTAWGTLSEDSVKIRFYANDTAGNIGSAVITVEKDINAPVITIIFPFADSVFGLAAPNYNISINELNLDTMWYTLDGGGTNYTITNFTGQLNQAAWDALNESSVIIRFYANDTAGNIGYRDVEIVKEIPEGPDDVPIISFGNYYVLFTVIAILSFIILEKHKKK